MKIEIETRFLGIDKNALILKLNELGSVDKGEVKLNDTIFYDKNSKWLEENIVVKLREKNSEAKLIYKVNKENKIDSAREIEFSVSSPTDAKEFLEAIGLVAYRAIEKFRHSFLLDNVIIDIDTWPKIPVYVELEGDSVEDLKKVAAKLKLNWEDRFDGDPRMVFKKYGFDFDNIRTITFDKFE